MSVGAPKDNTNAEKWTEEEAIQLFEYVYEKAKETTEYLVHGATVLGYNCHFIGEACDEAETTIDKIKYIRDKYNLRSLYNKLKRKCERNCFTDSKKGIIIPSLAIVNLKSNHGWTDRAETTLQGGDRPIQTTTINLGNGEKPE